jgi:hypothetical protein
MPVSYTHAQSITFTTTAQGNWEYSSGFKENSVYFTFVTPLGQSGVGIGSGPRDSGVSAKTKLEVFIADTYGQTFTSSCSTPKFTGDPTADLSCYAAAATDQGYPYVLDISPDEMTVPCTCP